MDDNFASLAGMAVQAEKTQTLKASLTGLVKRLAADFKRLAHGASQYTLKRSQG
jgi:hypothetical protein